MMMMMIAMMMEKEIFIISNLVEPISHSNKSFSKNKLENLTPKMLIKYGQNLNLKIRKSL